MNNSGKKLPKDINDIINSLCHDYKRRKSLLERGKAHGQVKRYYIRLNNAIDEALEEECDEGLRTHILNDIGENRGYRKSAAYFVSQVTYYDRKRRVKFAMAKKLHFI